MKLNYSNENSNIKIEGTSSVHDWDCSANHTRGYLDIDSTNNKPDIHHLELCIDVDGIKSFHPKMDQTIYKTMQKTNFPEITYSSNKNSINGNFINSEGKLKIAGVERKVCLCGKIKFLENHICIDGKCSLKMTDFDIAPPTAMMGTITTGDQIDLKFDVAFQ